MFNGRSHKTGCDATTVIGFFHFVRQTINADSWTGNWTNVRTIRLVRKAIRADLLDLLLTCIVGRLPRIEKISIQVSLVISFTPSIFTRPHVTYRIPVAKTLYLLFFFPLDSYWEVVHFQWEPVTIGEATFTGQVELCTKGPVHMWHQQVSWVTP